MKTLNYKVKKSNLDLGKINSNWLLLAGAITMMLSQLTFSIDIIGWIAMVPFLLYLHKTKGWKSRLLFVFALIIAWSLIVLKIISPPIPLVFIFLYSIPISLIHLPGYLLWDKYKNRKYSIFIFPAALTILEWVQYTYTPLASWGVAAYTQSHSLDILQFLSIFGMGGISFVIYWVNVSIAGLIVNKEKTYLNFILPLALTVLIILFGAFRTELSKSKGIDTITVATVGTDSEIGGLPLPTENKNENDIKAIIKRTQTAAKAGAKIAVWNEAAFLLKPNNEKKWIDTFQHLASESNITLVASYVLLISESPLQYENKFLLIDSKGKILHTYLKHQPVPGEPAKKGNDALKTFEVENLNFGGAICYDYDFPYLAKEYGSLHADLIALPASDWREIDPLHTRMAAYRAIEQGHSVLRSTRFGLSAAITPYGDMVAKMSSFDSNNKIMIAQIPSKRITTIYSIIGDTLIYFCIIFLLIFIFFTKKFNNIV